MVCVCIVGKENAAHCLVYTTLKQAILFAITNRAIETAHLIDLRMLKLIVFCKLRAASRPWATFNKYHTRRRQFALQDHESVLGNPAVRPQMQMLHIYESRQRQKLPIRRAAA
jgi:hypothetical protein